MNITLTLLWQTVAFFLFAFTCWKFIWPFLIRAMRERQETIAGGLENAAKAERDLQQAQTRAEEALNDARAEARGIVEEARGQAAQMIENAKAEADVERERILAAAQADAAQEMNRAKEALRGQVADLAVVGAEKILETSIDRDRHDALLRRLAAEL